MKRITAIGCAMLVGCQEPAPPPTHVVHPLPAFIIDDGMIAQIREKSPIRAVLAQVGNKAELTAADAEILLAVMEPSVADGPLDEQETERIITQRLALATMSDRLLHCPTMPAELRRRLESGILAALKAPHYRVRVSAEAVAREAGLTKGEAK